jgi:pyridoxamine 5'-phosphate oxidase
MPASFSTSTSVGAVDTTWLAFVLQCVFVCAIPYLLYHLSTSFCCNTSAQKLQSMQWSDRELHQDQHTEHRKNEHHILYWSYEANQRELEGTFGRYQHQKTARIPLCLQRLNELFKQNTELLQHIENDKKELLRDIQRVDDHEKSQKAYTTSEIMQMFQKWLETARTYQPYLIKRANAVCLSTVDRSQCPQSRFVLLKQIELQHGLFIFYTNYNSNKARQIKSNRHKWASMTFYWHILFCSVRITGRCEKLSPHKSDLYWKVRPKKCKLSAMSSRQSAVIADKQQLDANYEQISARFVDTDNEKIPRPEWGGYQLKAHTIEFWKGDSYRFHDRIQFNKSTEPGNLWTAARLQP